MKNTPASLKKIDTNHRSAECWQAEEKMLKVE